MSKSDIDKILSEVDEDVKKEPSNNGYVTATFSDSLGTVVFEPTSDKEDSINSSNIRKLLAF